MSFLTTTARLLLLATLSTSLPSFVQSHGFLSFPVARNGNIAGTLSNPGGKTPNLALLTPAQQNLCGTSKVPDVGVQAITENWTAGQVVQVEWDITLLHASAPGVRIAIQYAPLDTFNDNVLFNGLDVGLAGLNQITIKLPVGKNSTHAVLQWIWGSAADGGFYLGCSDITIQPAVPGVVVPIGAAPLPAAGTLVHIVPLPASVFTPTALEIAAATAAPAVPASVVPVPVAPVQAVPTTVTQVTPPVTPIGAAATAKTNSVANQAAASIFTVMGAIVVGIVALIL